MRLRWCVAALALTACRFDAGGAGSDGGGGGGGAGDAPHGIDAPGSGSGSGSGSTTEPDGDGDGVPDASDNCPTIPNPGQYDFDRDGKGDVCDLCPQLAGSASNIDTDGDNIGDGCDPRVATPDVRVAFYNFADPAALTGWTLGSGWALGADGLDVVLGAKQSSYANMPPLATALTNPVLATQFSASAVADPDNEADLAVCSGPDNCCGVYDVQSDSNAGTPYAFTGPDEDDTEGSWSVKFLPGITTAHLAFTSAPELDCELVSGTKTASLADDSGVALTVTGPRFFAARVTGTYKYLFVIDSR